MKNAEDLYKHGGNIYEISSRYRRDIIDFSANINPWGIPFLTRRLLRQKLNALVHYPDPDSQSLKAVIADYWKIKEENILVGNGSTELIYLIFNAFRPAVVALPVPSFTEYERAAMLVKSKISFVRLYAEEEFCLDCSRIDNSDMVFLCNPNNPTGNLLIKNCADIKSILAKRIVIDEAFMDFVRNEDEYTFVTEAIRSKGVIVVRTFTKFFALPGLRAGYIIAHKDTICGLKKYQMPWTVNVLAQAASQRALSENAFIQRSKEFIAKESSFLYKRLGRIKGLKPYPSAANFLLVKIEHKHITSSCLKERLLKKGFFVRDCANFRGLDKQFIRVAVRTRKENMQLAQALEECV
ncbi:MAG: threonine-phosphate decarboxylase CobD [Pseudomonadota bacterium]